MTAACCTIESPVGPLTITAEDGAITAVDFGGGGGPRPNNRRADRGRRPTQREYFAGDLPRIRAAPRAPRARSFRRRVWAAMQAIPYGETRSYGDLARALDSAPRAIGGACRCQSDPPHHPVPPGRRGRRRARRLLRRRRL